MEGLEAALIFSGAAKREAKAYTDEKISEWSSGINWKGYVDYYGSLPASPSEGDAYTIRYTGSSGTTEDGRQYAWGKKSGTSTFEWVLLGNKADKVQNATNGGLAGLNSTGNLTDTGIKLSIVSGKLCVTYNT